MVPMRIVPASETTRMIVVLTNPSSILPLTNAVAKFSTLNQFDGGSSGPVFAYSSLDLNAAMKIVTSGMIAAAHAITSETYLSVVPRGPRIALNDLVCCAKP
ncbi:hypothetical protein D3C74_425660 [compost metagenome]